MPINNSSFTSYIITDEGIKETIYNGNDRYYSADEVDFFIESLRLEVESSKEVIRDTVNNIDIEVIDVNKIKHVWSE